MADVGNFTTIDDLQIKEVYPQGVFDNVFHTRAPYREDLKKDTSFPASEGVVKFPGYLDGMWSVGITADNAAFPTPKDPVHVKFELRPETFSFTIQVGLKTKVAAKSGKSTFHSGGILGHRLESAADELASYINRVYCGSNRGRLATVESDGSSTFVAAKPYGTSLLEEGMRLEAYTALSGGSARDSFTNHKITAIDHSTRTVTYVGASDTTDDRTLVAGDSIFITGSYAQAPVGLPDIVDDGTLSADIHGITRSTYPKTKGIVKGNGGVLRDISQDLLMEGADEIRRFTNKRPTRCIINRGQVRKLREQVDTAVQFDGAKRNFPMGVTPDSFSLSTWDADFKFKLDDHCTPRSAFILSWDTFFLYNALDPDWLGDLEMIPTDGGHKAGYLKEYGCVENQGCLMPRANVRYDDLSDPNLGDS
jgi:hypothetical protein